MKEEHATRMEEINILIDKRQRNRHLVRYGRVWEDKI
jgi:hypothetical protein